MIGRIEQRAGRAAGGRPADDTKPTRRCWPIRSGACGVFDNAAGKMNLALADIASRPGRAPLVVSQFTLLADCRKGRRPSFTDAAPPEQAE